MSMIPLLRRQYFVLNCKEGRLAAWSKVLHTKPLVSSALIKTQREIVTMNKFGVVCIVMGALALFSKVSVAQEFDCSAEVTATGGLIEVAASSGGDDTENLQCALNAAADGGYKDVYLSSSEYSVGGIEVNNFKGSLRGRSADLTTVNITDGALSCEKGAALRFNAGAPSVERMSLNISEPCSTPGGSASLIGFYTSPETCTTNRTIFGSVDRVIIEGAGSAGLDFVTGITIDASPECFPEDGNTPLPVANKVLGSLTVNRNQIRDLDIGIFSALSGAGQMDITFNVVQNEPAGTPDIVAMERLGIAISIVDANQNTTIYRNEISYNDVQYSGALDGLFGTTGILVGSTAAAENINKTTFNKNTFTDGGVHAEGYALLSAQQGKSVNHEVVITGNTLTGNEANTSGAGLAVLDTSSGLISGNTFKGDALSWVTLDSGDVADGGLGATVSGWAIVANAFAASTATTDITLGSKTQDIIVGRSQGQPVVSDAGSNDVLESAASARTFLGNSPISVGSEAFFERQLETIQGRGAPLRKLGR